MAKKVPEGAGYQLAMNAPVPLRTDSYSPIPHSFFLESIMNQVNNTSDLETTSRRVYTNNAGTKLVCFIGVKFRGMETDHDFELEMMIGGKNSYDKSMAAAIVAGASVMICSNGVIAGDMITFKRKHTGTIAEELREKTTEGIQLMKDNFNNLVLQVDIMKDYDLTPTQKAEIMGVMYFEEEIVTPNQLSIIKKEMKESEHFRGNSLWDLYNNVTQSLKTSHPFTHIEDHIKLHDFMCRVVGIEGMETTTENEEAEHNEL